jgi:hypothetical protein
MLKHEKVLWITRTALLITITVVLQALTVPLGNQLITGSIVNMMLVVAVMTCGLPTGLTVSAVTPVLPTLLGFGPLWPIVPFIAAANMTLVTIWYFLGNLKLSIKTAAYIAALFAGALGKFLVLYLGVVQIAIPYILDLPEPARDLLSVMFSLPQLITASLGGACAIILLPTLKKAISK